MTKEDIEQIVPEYAEAYIREFCYENPEERMEWIDGAWDEACSEDATGSQMCEFRSALLAEIEYLQDNPYGALHSLGDGSLLRPATKSEASDYNESEFGYIESDGLMCFVEK